MQFAINDIDIEFIFGELVSGVIENISRLEFLKKIWPAVKWLESILRPKRIVSILSPKSQTH
jgi:hypothetical protein